MAIDVTVTEQCNRCKRKEKIIISSDKIEAFEKKQLDAEQYQNAVKQFVSENEGKLPDLVVIFKGKVQMLSQVCDAHCAGTVQNNVDALFREHKPRAPRKPKPKDGPDASAKDSNGSKDDKKTPTTTTTAKSGKANKAATTPAG